MTTAAERAEEQIRQAVTAACRRLSKQECANVLGALSDEFRVREQALRAELVFEDRP